MAEFRGDKTGRTGRVQVSLNWTCRDVAGAATSLKMSEMPSDEGSATFLRFAVDLRHQVSLLCDGRGIADMQVSAFADKFMY